MSRSQPPSDRLADGAPTNAELGERMARMEAKQDHVVEKIDTLADALEDESDDLADAVDENDRRVTKVYYAYRLGRWTIGSGSLVAIIVAVLL